MFNSLNIKFNYWRNKILTLKEIEHALCEFSKYYRIRQGIITKNKSLTRLRMYTSLSKLDLNNVCKICCIKRNGDRKMNGIHCDTCNSFYCNSCNRESTSSSIHWCCNECELFDKKGLSK